MEKNRVQQSENTLLRAANAQLTGEWMVDSSLRGFASPAYRVNVIHAERIGISGRKMHTGPTQILDCSTIMSSPSFTSACKEICVCLTRYAGDVRFLYIYI